MLGNMPIERGNDLNLIMDIKTEKVLFVVLSLSGSDKMVTVPWNKVQLYRTEGKLRLGGKAADFRPELNPQLTRRKSPRIAVLWNEAEQLQDSMSDENSTPERGSTQEEWSDPDDGLTPYSYRPLTEENEGGSQ